MCAYNLIQLKYTLKHWKSTFSYFIPDCLNPAALRADAGWISEGRSHTRAVARLHNIQPHKLQRAVGPFAVHDIPYGIHQPGVSTMTRPAPPHAPRPCANRCRPPPSRATCTWAPYRGTRVYTSCPTGPENTPSPSTEWSPSPWDRPHQNTDNKHIPGDKRTQAPDEGKKAHQRAIAHIIVHPAADLPKDFSRERHIVLEGQAHHIITAALYTLAAHERHWDPTTIPAMPPPPQGPKDPVTPFHIDQLLSRRGTPHLHPSRIELTIASWDTLDTPPGQRAIHILRADAQWGVLHWAHRVLMAAQTYTPEIDLEDPPRGRQRLLQATTRTGCKGTLWEALETALYWAQGSPNGPDTPEPTEAWVMQAKTMRNYHPHHPFDESPAALPWPSDPPETVRKLADLMRSHAKANMQTPAEPPLRDPGQQATHPFFKPHAPPAPLPPVPSKRARRKRGAPAPNGAGKAATSRTPRTLPDPPGKPGPSILVILPPIITTTPAGPGILIILPPATSTAPARGVPRIRKGRKVQQPFRNDRTGEWIWCEGTIQYRLRDPGDNGRPQILVVWHRQKEPHQGSSAPDRPEGHTLELTSAHPIRRGTDKNKAHRGTKYTGELPQEWSQGLLPPRLPKRPPTGKKSPSPSLPP